MKLIKGFIFAIVGLCIMITAISLLMPSKVMTARSVVVHANTESVFQEIADLQNWKHWHPVFMNDSAGIKISNPSSGVNASASWETNGKVNTFLITALLANQINATLKRNGENDVFNIISINDVSDSTAVQVEWKVMTKLKWYPWEKFSGIFVDKMTGPGYEAALNELKNLVENKK